MKKSKKKKNVTEQKRREVELNWARLNQKYMRKDYMGETMRPPVFEEPKE